MPLTTNIVLEPFYRHTYDANGRITNAYDPEGGSWNYSRTVDNTGTIHTDDKRGQACNYANTMIILK